MRAVKAHLARRQIKVHDVRHEASFVFPAKEYPSLARRLAGIFNGQLFLPVVVFAGLSGSVVVSAGEGPSRSTIIRAGIDRASMIVVEMDTVPGSAFGTLTGLLCGAESQ